MKTLARAFGIVILMAIVSQPATAQPIPVNCDAGGTITQALATAQPGATIQVTGTCQESITITTDRVTLDGQGIAVIDGGGKPSSPLMACKV